MVYKYKYSVAPKQRHSHQKMEGNIPQNGCMADHVAVVMVPLPAQGNLNLLLHLSRLVASYDIPVYYTGAATHIRQAKLRVQGWDPNSLPKLHFHEFHTPSFESPDPDPTFRPPVQLLPSFRAALLLREPLRDFLEELSKKTRRVVVIYDYWMSWNVQDIPNIPKAESYAFRSTSAFATYSFNREMTQNPPLPPEAEILRQLPAVEAFSSEELDELDKLHIEAKKFNSGTIFNSCRVIEGTFLDLLAKVPLMGKQWAVGPFNPIESCETKERHKCLAWLDTQEENSVIFISFGSTVSFSKEQTDQIAFGLAQSEQKFIWALREADKGDVFAGDENRVELPEGYEEGIEGKGMVVRDWAPQLEILAHRSTGGFMSHCGWNSCVEAISMGVPIAAWPVHSDQPMNATLVTKLLEIGVEVDDCADPEVVISSHRIAEAVGKLMGSIDGEKMRERARELSRAVKLSVMEGGDSRLQMDSFIAHITR
ncbi:unnamed protein product [Cuscuta epithymum]|uniref:Glycosyltransferase n=1 Tax=Cuscuta epithymum TaxID=186058 RepID=A0AAV0EWL3_9ASTE|nr:unnamed protein product [Cuscuta epithymum]